MHPEEIIGASENFIAAASRLGGAIRFRTIAFAEQEKIDGSQFLALHEHLRASYLLTAERLTWERVADYSLLLTWKGESSEKPLALLAHMDVVPVTPGTESDWTHEPFSGHFDGQYVWGRGALDMKGQLISILEAVEGLLAQGFRPARDVYLCFGHNEEIVAAPASGARAIMELLRSRGIQLETIIDEGGAAMDGKSLLGLPGTVAVVGLAEKGYMDVRLSCAQSGGHSSQPPRSTALGILAGAVHTLEKRPFPPRLTGTVRSMLRHASERMGFGKRLMLRNLWLTKPLVLKIFTGKSITNALVRTTSAATMAQASPAANVLPQYAEVTVNMRLLPGDTMESALEAVRCVIGDDRVKVERIKGKNPSFESSADTEGYRAVKAVLEKLYPGIHVAPYLMVGGTDSCIYEPVCRNIYRVSPFFSSDEDMKSVHGTNERMSLGNLVKGIEFFTEILRGN